MVRGHVLSRDFFFLIVSDDDLSQQEEKNIHPIPLQGQVENDCGSENEIGAAEAVPQLLVE